MAETAATILPEHMAQAAAAEVVPVETGAMEKVCKLAVPAVAAATAETGETAGGATPGVQTLSESAVVAAAMARTG